MLAIRDLNSTEIVVLLDLGFSEISFRAAWSVSLLPPEILREPVNRKKKKKLKSVIRMEREEGLSDLKYYILNKLRGARSGRILFFLDNKIMAVLLKELLTKLRENIKSFVLFEKVSSMWDMLYSR